MRNIDVRETSVGCLPYTLLRDRIPCSGIECALTRNRARILLVYKTTLPPREPPSRQDFCVLISCASYSRLTCRSSSCLPGGRGPWAAPLLYLLAFAELSLPETWVSFGSSSCPHTSWRPPAHGLPDPTRSHPPGPGHLRSGPCTTTRALGARAALLPAVPCLKHASS